MYTIAEKQQLINRLKSEECFDKDLSLFVRVCPRHNLNRELAGINKFNISRLHGAMINYLLDKVTAEDIEANRGNVIQPEIITEEVEIPEEPPKAPGEINPQTELPQNPEANPVTEESETPVEQTETTREVNPLAIPQEKSEANPAQKKSKKAKSTQE